MIIFLFVFLFWFPIALVIDLSVRSPDGPIIKWWKTGLFWTVTLPVIWFRVLDSLVEKYVKSSLLTKLASWFKS